MKHLFFVALTGIFSATTIAQSNANNEPSDSRSKPSASLKFIEDIEIVPGNAVEMIEVHGNKITSAPAVATPTVFKTGFISNIELCSALQFKYATMMDREVESIANSSLYSFIDNWWATRYQYGGADRSGIDCSAFTEKLLSEVYNIAVPRMAKDQYKLCEKLATEELVEGDLVFFDTRGGISHVGLYLGNNYFVHSSVSSGVTISNLNEEYYSKRFISGGRLNLRPAKEELTGVLVSSPAP